MELSSGDYEGNSDMIYTIFILIEPSVENLWPVDEDVVILKEYAFIKRKMFNHRIKVISQNHFVCFYLSFLSTFILKEVKKKRSFFY